MPFLAIGIDIFANVEYNSNKEGRRMDERNSLFDVRLEGVQIENFKNVKQGTVVLPNASNRKKPDILGLYGQNGSGKTALIDAISLLKCLLMGMSVPSQYADYINLDSDSAKITYSFILSRINSSETIKIIYKCVLIKEEATSGQNLIEESVAAPETYKAVVQNEKLTAILMRNGKIIKRSHSLIDTDSELLPFLPKGQYNSIFGESKINSAELLATKRYVAMTSRSFIFSRELINLFRQYCKDADFQLILESLYYYAHIKLFIVNTSNSAMISLNVLPFAFNYKDSKHISSGVIPIQINGNATIPEDAYNNVKQILDSMNIVLKQVIPGLTVSMRSIGKETDKAGKISHRIQLYSNRNNKAIPLQFESEGIKKIVSVLNLLINVYNEHAVTVAIDELDSGIFEYLLGELLKIISEHGKGQLIFTSHNLRPLETINKSYIVFTTTDEKKRYIRPKNIKSTNNLRAYYYRDITLGEQPDCVYEETNNYEIALAFEEAGGNCG